MIYVECDGDSSYKIEADHLSTTESVELDRRAVQQAIDRYLNHIDQLYADPPAELDGTTLWLINPATRRGNAFFGGVFKVYFLLAKLRILLSENPQPVNSADTIDHAVDRTIARVCEEYDVEYRPDLQNQYQKRDYYLHSGQNAFGGPIQHRLLESFAHLRRWLIYTLFVVIRPIVLKLYSTKRDPVDVRFWLHPTLSNRERFFNAPADLESKGRQVGYAVSFFVDLSSLRTFIWRTFVTLQRAFDPNEPVHIEWFAHPADFQRAIRIAPVLHAAIRRAAIEVRERAASPELKFLAWQLDKVSPGIVFQYLFIERALDRFAQQTNDEIWSYAHQVNTCVCRMMGLVADRRDIKTVNVAPHYYSETRISNRFSEREVHGPETIALPDLFMVFEPRSAKTLREQNLRSRQIIVARDKVDSEAGGLEEIAAIKNQQEPPTPSFVSKENYRTIKLLVLLQKPDENAELVEAVERAIQDFPGIQVMFKPHPFSQPGDTLFKGFKNANIEVTSPDASLKDVVRACDICISIYSTATFPALTRAIPVIWVPFVSQNHVVMDLLDDVGIRADDPKDLLQALDQLIHDEAFYVKQARDCVKFATDDLVPEANAPSLADVFSDVECSQSIEGYATRSTKSK